MRRLSICLTIACIVAGCRTVEVIKPSPRHVQSAHALANDTRVKSAFDFIEADRDRILSEWRALTEINAPSGYEQERAAFVEKLLQESTSLEVSRDSVGNVLARRRGSAGAPTIVIDAHLDTVFQPGLQIVTTIQDGKLFAPGVGDNTRNIEALLAIIRALDHAGVRTKGDLLFTFTVEEETNFRGINQLIADHPGKIDHLIALDGGFEGFTYGGIGINWYRHHFIGPGGHTRSRTPPYSAALPLSRAIARIYKLRVPDDPPSHVNIGMLGGSAVVNAKADDAWFTLDLRSTSNDVISRLERQINDILEAEARRDRMTLKTDVISKAPAAQIPGHRQSDLVLTSEGVHLALGFEPPITPTASNHANPALLAGISAISTGVAPCGDAHAVTESCVIEPIYRGIKKVLLLGVAMAGLE